MKIIVPKRYVALTPMSIPVFVAGPIKGGDDWQAGYVSEFMRAFKSCCSDTLYRKLEPRLRFIVPCRWKDDHTLAEYFATNFELDDYGQDEEKESQTFMEIHYLNQIVVPESPGIVVFGLLPESKTNPRNDGSPYGRDSYGEIGRWTTVAHFRNADNIYIGMHDGWGGASVIKKNLDFWSRELVRTNLLRTVSHIELARWTAEVVMYRHSHDR